MEDRRRLRSDGFRTLTGAFSRCGASSFVSTGGREVGSGFQTVSEGTASALEVRINQYKFGPVLLLAGQQRQKP